MVKKVYVQFGADGVPIAPCGFALWEGARFLGLEPEGFREDKLGELPLTKETLVHGWVRTVHRALDRLGAPIPAPLDYPEELDGFLYRELFESNLGKVHRDFVEDEHDPVFIKPVRHKLFAGHTIERFSDLTETDSLPPATEVYVSEMVDFKAEFRCFVHERALIDVRRYRGDPWLVPDRKAVTSMILAYKSAPVAYGLDVGVLADGRTALVEVNDCYALGEYGLGGLPYTEMVVSRWEQMVEEVP